MDKEKEIKKMLGYSDYCQTRMCGACLKCDNYYFAEALVNSGYRKIPEGAVVLTKEELNDRLYQAYSRGVNFAGKQIENQKEKARKGTAKEIFEKIQENLCVFTTQGKSDDYNDGYCQAIADIDERIQKVAKEYGVEVDG